MNRLMALTRTFRDTVVARAGKDPEIRRGLFQEALEAFLNGVVGTGRIVLRDYINATIGFEELAREPGKSPKSLMRMLGKSGNPRADNLFAILTRLKNQEGVRLQVRVDRAA